MIYNNNYFFKWSSSIILFSSGEILYHNRLGFTTGYLKMFVQMNQYLHYIRFITIVRHKNCAHAEELRYILYIAVYRTIYIILYYNSNILFYIL